MLNTLERVAMERELTMPELQRYLFRLVEQIELQGPSESGTAPMTMVIPSSGRSPSRIPIDSVLNEMSTNPVENGVITRALEEKVDKPNFLTNMEIEELLN